MWANISPTGRAQENDHTSTDVFLERRSQRRDDPRGGGAKPRPAHTVGSRRLRDHEGSPRLPPERVEDRSLAVDPFDEKLRAFPAGPFHKPLLQASARLCKRRQLA